MNDNFSYNKEGILRKNREPSEWVDMPQYIPITRLRISCGGGMGGAQWFEYIKRVDNIPSNDIVKLTRYDGKKILINTHYIVDAEDFTLAIAKLDITKWKEVSHSDIYDENPIQTQYVLIDDNTILQLKD